MDTNTKYLIAMILAVVTVFKVINVLDKQHRIPESDWAAVGFYVAFAPIWIGLAWLYSFVINLFF